MGQTRFGGSFGDDTEYGYDASKIRELVLSNFEDLSEAIDAAVEVLKMLSTDVIDSTPVTTSGFEHYSIVDVDADEERTVRPINTHIFIQSVEEFKEASKSFTELLELLRESQGLNDEIREEYEGFVEENRINETLYTIAQGIGIGLDALASSKNKARRNAGLRFESLNECILCKLNVANKKHRFVVPIEDTDDYYSNTVDLMFGPHEQIQSTEENLDDEEVVASVKTTSKERMAKEFAEMHLISETTGQYVPFIALFLNDIQRKGDTGMNGTFLPNNYYTYANYLAPIEGTYFIDPPDKIDDDDYIEKLKLKTYREFLLEDLWELTDTN